MDSFHSNTDSGFQGTLSLGLAVKALSKFDGRGYVEEFIYATDDILDCVKEEEKTLFFKIIRTQIVGEASMAIRGSDDSWPSTRRVLFEIYGDKKTITEIERNLMEARQEINETVDVFAARIRRLSIRYTAILQNITERTQSIDEWSTIASKIILLGA